MSESKTVPEKKAGPITGWPCPGLRHAKRLITTHDKDGQSVFHTEDDGQHHRVMVKGMAVANIMYNTKEHQVDMNDEKDIAYARENEVKIAILEPRRGTDQLAARSLCL